MNKKEIKNNKISGFTLIETMIAVFILTFSISILMGVVANGLFAAKYAGDEITANYLIQEVADYIRNDRDTNVFLMGMSWGDFYKKYEDKDCHTDGCTLDINNEFDLLEVCPSGDCKNLYYHTNLGNGGSFYDYDISGVESSFKRKVKVNQNIDNPDQIDIEIIVSWFNGEMERSKSLKTSLLKWR